MDAQRAIDQSQPMLDDVLGRIGLHQTGAPLDFNALRQPFSTWLQQQSISQDDFAFLVSLVGAFICEYLVAQSGAQRFVAGSKICLRLPIQAGVAREFDPYATAVGLVRERGIGGNGTGRANMLIYAMQVTSTPSYGEFQTIHPRAASYLRGHGVSQDAPVLVSNRFYYFGSSAPSVPSQLKHIIHPTQGCKRLSAQDLAALHTLILSQYTVGRHGSPNNKVSAPSCGGCER